VNRTELWCWKSRRDGIDPQARHLVWERLRDLKRAASLLLPTHYMEEAAQLCDRLS